MTVGVSYKKPGKNMEWLIKQFLFISFDGKSEVLDKFIPRDDISLVFHFKTPPCMLKPVEGQLPAYFIAPVITKANLMRISKKNETLVVTCKPTVFSRIFNISLAPGPQIYLPLPESPFHILWQELTLMKNLEERVACFERFISGLFTSTYVPDEVDRFYDKILTAGFNIPMTVLEKSLAVCERTIQRQFKSRVGVCPKSLARIVRLNYLWRKLRNEGHIDYQNVVFDGNYFDQTHFIKDFKEITDETPGRFFTRDLRYVKILSGRKD